MADYHTLAERYIAAWNEPDPARRRALIKADWSPEARYVDPLMAGQGHDGIAAMIEGARAQFPGHTFTLRGDPDGYGRSLRFSWLLTARTGAAVAGGTDMVRLDGEGRIAEVTGFLDRSVVPQTSSVPTFAVAHLRSVRFGPAIAEYLRRIDATLEPFGGRFRVHGASPEVLEGQWCGDLVVIEFPDRTSARDWYASPLYRTILPLRLDNSEGEVILIDTVAAEHRATDLLT